MTGFEPTTSWSRTMRATKLRYTSARKIIAHSQFLFNCFSINIIAENYKTSLITYIILRKKLQYYKKDGEKLFTSRRNFDILVCVTWEHSSAGRASALQAGGHRFEPCCSHHAYAGVAQLVERRLAKAKAAGSSPVSRSNMAP